jgi:hypothetical protein
MITIIIGSILACGGIGLGYLLSNSYSTVPIDIISVTSVIDSLKLTHANQMDYITYLQYENQSFFSELTKLKGNFDDLLIKNNELMKQNHIFKNQIVYDNILLNLNIDKIKIYEQKEIEFIELIKSQNNIIMELNGRKQELLKEVYNLKKELIIKKD